MNRSCRYACICIVYILYIPYLDGTGYSHPHELQSSVSSFPPFLSRSCRNGNSCSVPSPGSSPVKLQKAMWSRPTAARVEGIRWLDVSQPKDLGPSNGRVKEPAEQGYGPQNSQF